MLLKKIVLCAVTERMLINAVGGRIASGLIITKSNHAIVSALPTKTFNERVADQITMCVITGAP
jgi:regulator of extracellular matrix RemA (YlzA/DUF370 family)